MLKYLKLEKHFLKANKLEKGKLVSILEASCPL